MIIGLTGGIASGKSVVSAWLREHGVVVLDADTAARAVVAPGTALLTRIVEKFGLELLSADGTLDRPATARMIYTDPNARAQLNAMMHPAILAFLQNKTATVIAQGETFLVWDVPLLIDVGWHNKVDAVWVVRAHEDRQIRRLQDRDGLTEDEARLRLAAQIDASRREAVADELIENNGSLEELYAQMARLVKEYREKSREQSTRA